jgi:hypothetical protein
LAINEMAAATKLLRIKFNSLEYLSHVNNKTGFGPLFNLS